MDRRTSRTIRGALGTYVVVGAIAVVWLLLTPRMTLGQGGLAPLLVFIEQLDFRWPLLVAVLVVWLTPLLTFGAVSMAVRYELLDRGAVELLTDLLRDRTFPIAVHVDQRLPIKFDEELRLPIKLQTHVDIERDVEITTTVPIRTTLDVNTTVAPNVLGLGNVKIPIRTQIPIHMDIPVAMPVHISLKQLPVAIDEEVAVRLPPIEAPIDARLHMRIKLFEGSDGEHEDRGSVPT